MRPAPIAGLALLGAGCGLVANLGDPRVVGDGATAVQATSVAVGTRHACAVISSTAGAGENGTVRCWGSNESAQLGSDPDVVARSSTPREVVDASGVEQHGVGSLALATSYSCAVSTQDGFLLCWGAVPAGSGVTREPSAAAWVPSQMDLGSRKLQVTSASMTDEGGCCTLSDGSLVCWGPDLARGAVTDPLTVVTVGRAHACGIATTGAGTQDVECWGANDHGQAGMPPSPVVTQPARLGLGPDVVAIATGGDDSCAIVGGGSLVCWGAGAGSDHPSPVSLAGAALALAVGDGHACALLGGDRTVSCWTGGSPTPAAVEIAAGQPLSGVQSIAAAGGTSCAVLRDDPRVWCWGANDQGQAGQPPGGPLLYATPVAW